MRVVLLQFLIILRMLIWNINQNVLPVGTPFHFTVGCSLVFMQWVSVFASALNKDDARLLTIGGLISYLQNLKNICNLMMPLPKKWEAICLTQTRLALFNNVGTVHLVIPLLLKITVWLWYCLTNLYALENRLNDTWFFITLMI